MPLIRCTNIFFSKGGYPITIKNQNISPKMKVHQMVIMVKSIRHERVKQNITNTEKPTGVDRDHVTTLSGQDEDSHSNK